MRKSITLAALSLAFLLGLVPFALASAQPGGAVTVYAVSVSNKLLSFSSASPGTIQNTVQISGLQTDENVLGIDFRPATGQLYGLGSSSRLYTIDTGSGAATQVGSPLTTTLSGADFGFDFNPVVDRIRITSNEDQDLRVNPNNGTIAAIDGTLVYSTTDSNAGQNPNVVASAYSNNIPGPSATTLYNIDSNRDVLVTQNPPNSGTLNTVGSLGSDVTGVTGFDIAGANTAFASASLADGPPNTTGLYSVNLTTGALTLVASIGGGEAVRDISIALSATPATVTPAPTATTTFTPGPTATPCPGGAVVMFTINASGSQEVPPNNNPGSATGTFTLDPATNMITFNVTMQGVVSETAAHLHRGAVGVNGPVIVPLPVGNTKSGTVAFPAEEVANLRAGNFYFNSHNPEFPGGVVRGQLVGQCPGGSAPTATAAATSIATAPVATPAGTLPPAPTQQPATPVPATAVPVPPTAVVPVEPTVIAPVEPTIIPVGMPSTGSGGDTNILIALALFTLGLVSLGLLTRKRGSRSVT